MMKYTTVLCALFRRLRRKKRRESPIYHERRGERQDGSDILGMSYESGLNTLQYPIYKGYTSFGEHIEWAKAHFFVRARVELA
jgi:hypothetical protein